MSELRAQQIMAIAQQALATSPHYPSVLSHALEDIIETIVKDETMNEEENGTTPEQPAPSQVGLNMQINQQGVILTFPVNLGMDNATAIQFVKAYLQAHPDVLEEIAREAVAVKRKELQVIQMVRQSRNDQG